MQDKKFISNIYLYKGNVVSGESKDNILSNDPIKYAISLTSQNIDALIVCDLSENEDEHEAAIDLIKEITAILEVPVYGSGNIHRMEDVKKLLYAGCYRAILDYRKNKNIAITEEVSGKFGKSKIMVQTDSLSQIHEYRLLIETNACEILYTGSDSFSLDDLSQIPVLCSVDHMSVEKAGDILIQEQVSGITGLFVNQHMNSFDEIVTAFQLRNIPVKQVQAQIPWDHFKLNSDGMIPVVTQDYKTGEVLMVAYMNEEAYNQTVRTGKMTYYSRSRQELWLKGETSGHFQYVKALYADCDSDTLLAKVSQKGVACHTGKYSCFFQEILKKPYNETNPLMVFEDVMSVINDRKEHPKEGSYTNYLFDKGIDKILKKLGEEATEIVIASKNPNSNEIKYEIADFLYHMMVLMSLKEVTWEEIATELADR